jgi:sulfite reductase alpha subunit-like flavoprotein
MALHNIRMEQMLLLFGCRSLDEDFLYADEWNDFEKRLSGFEVMPCFSRYNGKIYVQDRLAQIKDIIVALME